MCIDDMEVGNEKGFNFRIVLSPNNGRLFASMTGILIIYIGSPQNSLFLFFNYQANVDSNP